jgi:ABC-type cobalamin/Fe3+-siderophores transport system ATPase subunit
VSALLSLQGVGKRYRRGESTRWLLRGATLHLDAGEVVSVVAMRGQGKTTLLRIAAGMVAPEEGRVLLGLEDLGGLSDPAHSRVLREQIGWAGRGGPGISVPMLDYVAMRLALGGRTRRRAVRSLALGALERVGMEHLAERHWEDLSDWERALVELAQAIAAGPRVLLVDDLLDGLGMRETEEVALLVRALARELGMGVLMTVSDPEAALCSHRVLSLAAGRLTVMAGAGEEQPGNVIDLSRHRRAGL